MDRDWINLIRETGTFIHYKNDPENNKSLSNNFVRVIYEDQAGDLWIGTEGGGLNKLDRDTNTFEHFKSNPGDIIQLK